jgi:hypothetical protein
VTWDGTFKYDPVNPNKVNEILTTYKGQPVLDYIIELYRLIEYQRDQMVAQEKQIILLKHIEAWKHYDKPLDQYNPKTRKYQ